MFNFNNITTAQFFTCTAASIIMGAVIALAFSFKSKKSGTIKIALGVLPVIVQVVIMLVNGNIGTGVAVMGAFSLVRFRSVPGDAKDICGIFLAMAVGLAMGTNNIALGVVFGLIVCAAIMIYTAITSGKTKPIEKTLTVVIPESLDYTDVFDDVFEKYAQKSELTQVKTTNMGSLFKLKYDIVLEDIKSEKKLIDEIRTRNGNLEVIISRKIMDNSDKL